MVEVLIPPFLLKLGILLWNIIFVINILCIIIDINLYVVSNNARPWNVWFLGFGINISPLLQNNDSKFPLFQCQLNNIFYFSILLLLLGIFICLLLHAGVRIVYHSCWFLILLLLSIDSYIFKNRTNMNIAWHRLWDAK